MASPLLDFRKFKHIKSDDKTTTLKHADGHTVTIMHNVLSKDNQKQLKAMSQAPEQKEEHGKVIVKEAEGGEIKGNPKLEESKKTPPDGHPAGCPTCGSMPQKYAEGAAVERELRSEEPIEPAPQPQEVAPAVAQATDFSQSAPAQEEPRSNYVETSPQPTQEQSTEAPQQMPVSTEKHAQTPDNPHTSDKLEPVQTPEEMSADLKAQDQQHQQDYLAGHINPKTYADLFASKSLPGKIGTVFGLLLSGAGSGLAHQPNALLAMMDKELERDYEAQKTNKTNAQNFFKLGMEQAMNKADIANKVKQGLLTDQQAKMLKVQTAIEGNALGQIQHNRAALHDQAELVKKLPPGSKARADAENLLGMMSQTVDAKNANLADVAQAKSALLNTISPSNGTDSAFADKVRQLKIMGMPEVATDMEQHNISGVPEVAGQRSEQPIPQQARDKITAMKTLDDKGKDVLNYIKQNSGTMNLQKRAVAMQKIEEMKNFYNNSINGGALTEGRLGWYDEQFAKHPTDILAQLMGSTAKLKETVDSNAHRKDIELKSLGFKPKHAEKSTNSAPASGKYKEGQTDTYQGKPIVFTNGAWKLK